VFSAKLEYNTNSLINKLYTEKEIQSFENLKNILFPNLMKNIYTGKIDIKALVFTGNSEELLFFILPISDSDCIFGEVSIEYILEMRNNFDPNKRIVVELPNKTAVPFGYDPFGNIFYMDSDNNIWFENHEQIEDDKRYSLFVLEN
jgi:hypothetical protein